MIFNDIEHQKGERVLRVCECGRKITYNMATYGLTEWESKKPCCVETVKKLKRGNRS